MTDETLLPVRVRSGPMMIKGLTPSLPERGHVKIGMKGKTITSRGGNEFQPPVKLDYFIVTGLDRDDTGNFRRDEAIHKRIGDKPKDIPVRLLYDDPILNFPTRYACYVGKVLWCSGDGEIAARMTPDNKARTEVACPCPRKEPDYTGKDKCKMNGNLSMLIDGVGGVGGVHKFRTTSYNSITGLLSSLSFIKSVTGGVLANIPLNLTVRPKQAMTPEGQQQTVYVVGAEYPGDIRELQQQGHQIALDRATTHMSIELIENEARRLLSAPIDVPLPGDDNSDIVEEYYPEQMGEGAIIPSRPTRGQFVQAEQPTQLADVIDVDPFAIIDGDSVVNEFDVATDAARHLCGLLSAAAKAGDAAAIEGIWESNELFRTRLAETDETSARGMDDFYAKAAQRKIAPPKMRANPGFWAREKLSLSPNRKGDRPDWKWWRAEMLTAIAEAQNVDELARLQSDNNSHLDGLHLANEGWCVEIMTAFPLAAQALSAPDEGAPQ